MLAYLCDRCPSRSEVINGNLTLPTGWVRVEMEKGTGVVNNPKTQNHLCPKCSAGFERAMREDVPTQRELKP